MRTPHGHGNHVRRRAVVWMHYLIGVQVGSVAVVFIQIFWVVVSRHAMVFRPAHRWVVVAWRRWVVGAHVWTMIGLSRISRVVVIDGWINGTTSMRTHHVRGHRGRVST